MFDQDNDRRVDLSAKENVVLEYMKESLQAKFPDLNLANNGVFMETFGETHINLLTPIFEAADRLLLMRSLNNADNLTEEEMDFIAEAYRKTRKEGEMATGLSYFVFNDIPKSGTVVIPADYQVTAANGETFFVTATRVMSEAQMVAYFDPERFLYRIPVPLAAVNPGVLGNIEPGSLTAGIIPLQGLVGIENDESFEGGTDRETNREFADRIKREGYAVGYGVDSGYENYVRNFKGAEECRVVGYGHPLMRRDIIGTTERRVDFKQTVQDVHWGTKIDLYVRGFNLETAYESLPVVELEDGGIGCYLSSKPVFDVIELRHYTYEGQLDDPNMDQTDSYVQRFVLEKDEDFETEGTIGEVAFLRILDPRVTTSHRVSVRYRYNRLIQEIYDGFYRFEERPPTADIKPKEAHQKYVYGTMTVKGLSGGLSERDRYLVQSRIRDVFQNQRLGIPIQFSDIQSGVTEQAVWRENALNLVDSIRLPSTAFLVGKNRSVYVYYTLSRTQRDFLDEVSATQPFLSRIIDRYRDTLKTYDYFDTIHAMSMDDRFDESMTALARDVSYDANAVDMLREMKQAYDASMMAKRLMPNELPCDEHEYFEVGDIFIHDDIDYGPLEWGQMLGVLRFIATNDGPTNNYIEMVELLMYILTLTFVLVERDGVAGKQAALYRMLYAAFRDTSIRNYIETYGEG